MFNLTAKSKSVAEVRLYGTVSEWGRINALDISKSLEMAKRQGFKKVVFRIHCPGGAMFEGVAVNSVISASELETGSIVDGVAASMGSAIAISTGHSAMMKGTRIMIHQGSGGVSGSANKIINYGNLLKTLNNDLAELYASKTGKDKQWILDNWMKEGEDKWFTAEEAKKVGLVDEVIPNEKKSKTSTEASFEEMAAYYNEKLATNYETEEKMDKSKLIKRLGLAEDATEEQIEAALTALETKAKANEKPQGNEKTKEKMVASFLTLGKKAGVVTKENEASMKKLAEADIDACMDLLPDAAAQAGGGNEVKDFRLSELIAALKGENTESSKKTWEDLTPNERKELEEKDPKAFEALFNAEYGNVKNG